MSLEITGGIGTYDVDVGTTLNFILQEHPSTRFAESYVYIYDVDTKEKICGHAVSSEGYVHILPSKDDPTMEYYGESGKDKYINGKQYYMMIMARVRNTGKWVFSESTYFYCFETPTIVFNSPSYGSNVDIYKEEYPVNIDVIVRYPYPALISATNKVQKYNIEWFNSGTTYASGFILGTGTNVSSEIIDGYMVTTYNIQYKADRFISEQSFKFRIHAYTESGMEIRSQNSGTVRYRRTGVSVKFGNAENISERGCIRLSGLVNTSTFEGIEKVTIQRQTYGAGVDDWVSLATVSVGELQDFVFDDVSVENGVRYLYRPVVFHIIDDVEIEAIGFTTSRITACFEGTFISDSESFIKLDTAIYTGMQVQQTVGVHNPLGSKYPIVVINGKTNYHTGGVGGKILNDSFGKKNPDGTYNGFNEYEAVKRRKELDKFLTNKKPKILRDSFGNASIIMVTEAPTYEFEEWNGALASLNFNYTEIGDPSNPNDIIRMGLGGVN